MVSDEALSLTSVTGDVPSLALVIASSFGSSAIDVVSPAVQNQYRLLKSRG